MRVWLQTIRIGLQGLALIVVLGLGLCVIVGLWSLHQQGIHLLSVRTGSMVPAVNIGDTVAVRPVNFAELSQGDIVSYHTANGSVITHRIVGLDRARQQVLTQGDRNVQADGYISSVQLVGKAIAVLPYSGVGAAYLRKPLLFLGLVYLTALIMIVREVRRLQNTFRPPYRVASYLSR